MDAIGHSAVSCRSCFGQMLRVTVLPVVAPSAPLDHSIVSSESVYLFCAPGISLTLRMLGERGDHKTCSDGVKASVAGLRNWEPLVGSLHAGGLGVMVAGLHEWSDMYLRQLPGRPSSLIQGCTACPR